MTQNTTAPMRPGAFIAAMTIIALIWGGVACATAYWLWGARGR